jgi:hypothetical protein
MDMEDLSAIQESTCCQLKQAFYADEIGLSLLDSPVLY